MTKTKSDKKLVVEGKKKPSHNPVKKSVASSTDDEEEASSSTRPSLTVLKGGTLSSTDGSGSSSSGSSSGSSSSSSSDDEAEANREEKGKVVKKKRKSSGVVAIPTSTSSPAPVVSNSTNVVKSHQQSSPSTISSTINNGHSSKPQQHKKKKKSEDSHNNGEISSMGATSSNGKVGKKVRVASLVTASCSVKLAKRKPSHSTVSGSGHRKKSHHGQNGHSTPPGRKVSTTSEAKPSKSSSKGHHKSSPLTGGKVPPKPTEGEASVSHTHKKHNGEGAKRKEKKLEVSSSSSTGIVTRSRSTSLSSSVGSSGSSSSSSSDSSSESSNESAASNTRNNDEVKKPQISPRLSSTSTSSSSSASGSSSSSSSDDDDVNAGEKTPVVRAPPAPSAKIAPAQNRVSKRDEKKMGKSRKKVLESKVIKARSSSSCSSSVERSSIASSTSSSSARSCISLSRHVPAKTKTELSIASNDNQIPDIIQKHWQQIPRVKAKPPASTTFIIPSTSEDNKSAKEEEEAEMEIEMESSRPVTRRQISSKKKSNKTIPTTTKFSLDKLHENLECNSSPRVVYNDASDSDYSCGSGNDNQVFIRCVPAKSSTSRKIVVEDNRVCMFPGCDSNGHLSGLYEKHCLVSCCPKFHIDSGFFLGRGEEESRTEDVDPGSGDELPPRNPSEECQQLCRMRSNRMTARSHYTPASSNPLTLIPTNNLQKLFKNPNKHHPQPQEVKQWIGKMKELKDTRIDSNTTEYDMSLWRDALALAAAQIESEQNASVQFNKWSLAMGKFEMGCWCCNPYPEPLAQLRRIFICEFCLKPVQSGTVLRRHCAKCVWRHPPGDEIYSNRKDRLSVWEVDGKTQKTYCQYLCLLAKCFLDHKTLYLDVDPFLFYVMTMADSQGCHIVGYFSKEKNSFLNYNVSCILTLPPYQRQGFGRLLIDFSYLLTRVEGKIGSPEKPLSDLGLISYRSYWKDAVLRRMCACASRDVSIKELSQELGISSADLVSTLQFLGMLKYWKGKHLILKKQDVLEEYLERVRRRGVEQRQIDSSCLRWRPYQAPPDNSQSQEESNSISSILNSVVSGGGGGGGGTD